MRGGPVALALLGLSAGPAWADSHGVTVQNGTGATIRSIVISPKAGSGENRLRSSLPPGASGRIAYSTGCTADVRIGYEDGRTEDHAGVDVCSEPRIVAGTDGVAGPAGPVAGTVKPIASTTAAAPKPGAVAVAPRPVVPPWTGHSITRRFGGMQ